MAPRGAGGAWLCPSGRAAPAAFRGRAAAGLDVGVLEQMAAARVWDVYAEAFEDQAAFDGYLDRTAGGLITSSSLIPLPWRL